jgi:hypothetical protein
MECDIVANAKYLLTEIDLTEYGLGVITLPKVQDIINIGEQKINEFLTPFLIDYKSTDEVKMFDLLFIDNEQMKNVVNQLAIALKVLYKSDAVKLALDETNNINIYVSDAIINRDNFDKLCDIVREMFFISKPQEEENRTIQVAEENQAILEEYLRLEQQHQKDMEELNKNNHKGLHQIITIVASQCLWDYDKVLSMTYYRLINTYVSIFKIDSYTTYMQYVTSGQFDMKNHQQKHWTEIVGN